jgi:hypothetical protein
MWDCGNHRGEFKKGTCGGLAASLTIAASLRQREDKVWANKVIKAIVKMR